MIKVLSQTVHKLKATLLKFRSDVIDIKKNCWTNFFTILESRKSITNKISHGRNYYFTHNHHHFHWDLSNPCLRKMLFNSFTKIRPLIEESKDLIAFLLHVCSTIKIHNILLLNIMMIQKICYFMCLLYFLFDVSFYTNCILELWCVLSNISSP